MQSPSSTSLPLMEGLSNASFLSSTTNGGPVSPKTRNFWDFDAYARVFLHERKAIEREKEEWKVQVEKRQQLLNESVKEYYSQLLKLRKECKATLQEYENIESQLRPKVVSGEEAIKEVKHKIELISKAREYFQRVAVVLECEAMDPSAFERLIQSQQWKPALDALLQLVSVLEESDSSSNLYKRVLSTIEERLELFSSSLKKKIGLFIDGLGWPRIQSNEQTVEIIAQLQELLTFGEALYLLNKRLDFEGLCPHPLTLFISPIKVRFDYHFSGDKQTNALEKPEWYLTHLIGLLRENSAFLKEFIFPCWRLRGLDDFIREGVWNIAVEKTRERLQNISDEDLKCHYLSELAKFHERGLGDEFAFKADDYERVMAELFYPDKEAFVEYELARLRRLYTRAFDSQERSDEEVEKSWRAETLGDPSPVVMSYLALLHDQCLQVYAVVPDFKCRAMLYKSVVSWLLERFLNKCQFECSPLHGSQEQILQDIGMINSMIVLKRVLIEDFGESLDMVEFVSSGEAKNVLGYDPSRLPGTIFSKAAGAFGEIGSKLEAHVFNYVMDGFLKHASTWSNSMCYYRTSESLEELPMNESFRLAVIGLLERQKLVKQFLLPSKYDFLFGKLLLEKIAGFLYSSVILKNFFHERGAQRFQLDVQYLIEQLSNDSEVGDLFGKVVEAGRLLMLQERDPTAPFDGFRLAKTIKEGRQEELKRFLELERYVHVSVSDLAQIFASRRWATL